VIVLATRCRSGQRVLDLDVQRAVLRIRRGVYVGLHEAAPTTANAERLRRIFEALRRIDAGTYGLCVRCDGAIDPDVLVGVPEAARCEVCDTF
jgi:hypothetical protein